MRAAIIYYQGKKYKKVEKYEKIKRKAVVTHCGKEFLPLRNLSFIGNILANYSQEREFYNLVLKT